MTYPYKIESSIKNKFILTKGTNVNIRKSASTGGAIIKNVAASGTFVGKCHDRLWFDWDGSGNITPNKWYEIEGNQGFIRSDVATLSDSLPATTTTTSTNTSSISNNSPSIVTSPSDDSVSTFLKYALIAAAGLLLVPKLMDILTGKK